MCERFLLGVKERRCPLSDRGGVYLEKAQIREFPLERCLIREMSNSGKCVIRGKCPTEGVVM